MSLHVYLMRAYEEDAQRAGELDREPSKDFIYPVSHRSLTERGQRRAVADAGLQAFFRR
jgi:hypothetical protein